MVTTNQIPDKKRLASIREWVKQSKNKLIETTVLIGLIIFLWFFYSAVADRLFSTGNRVFGDTGIINPLAYKTILSHLNFVAMFAPFIAFGIIGLIYHYWRKSWWKLPPILIVFASHIAMGLLMSPAEVGEQLSSRQIYLLRVLLIVIYGAGTLLVAGLLLYTRKRKPQTSDNIEE